MGHLVNHPGGSAGAPGVGYDYVLAADGVYVQAQGAHLAARVLVAPCRVRGLAPAAAGVALRHGPIPLRLLAAGLAWFGEDPDTERLFAVRWDGAAYRLVVPVQAGTAASLTYQPPPGVVAEVHSHGRTRAFFSATDDGDEQGLRVYGVAGRLGTALPELRLRVGVYGHFAPVALAGVFSGTLPGLRVTDEGTGLRRPARPRRQRR